MVVSFENVISSSRRNDEMRPDHDAQKLTGTSYNYTIDSSQYYIHIKEYRISGNISPLILVDNRIRKIIQNKNKLLFLKQLEEDLYNKAISDDKIKLFL